MSLDVPQLLGALSVLIGGVVALYGLAMLLATWAASSPVSARLLDMVLRNGARRDKKDLVLISCYYLFSGGVLVSTANRPHGVLHWLLVAGLLALVIPFVRAINRPSEG